MMLLASRRRRRQLLCSRANLLEQAAVVLAQPDQAGVAPLVGPAAQRALDQPRAVSIEIFNAGQIDRNAARINSARGGNNLRLDRTGIFGRPRSAGAEFDPVALHLTAEQGSCRHRATPSSTQQHRAPALCPSQAAVPRQDWMRFGGTLRSRHRPICKLWPQLKGRTKRNLWSRPLTPSKVNKLVAFVKRRLPN